MKNSKLNHNEQVSLCIHPADMLNSFHSALVLNYRFIDLSVRFLFPPWRCATEKLIGKLPDIEIKFIMSQFELNRTKRNRRKRRKRSNKSIAAAANIHLPNFTYRT